jgi:hypothetical protein
MFAAMIEPSAFTVDDQNWPYRLPASPFRIEAFFRISMSSPEDGRNQVFDGSAVAVAGKFPTNEDFPQMKRTLAVFDGPSPMAVPLKGIEADPQPNLYSRPNDPALVSKNQPDAFPGVVGVMKTVPPFGPVSPMRQRVVVQGPAGAMVVVGGIVVEATVEVVAVARGAVVVVAGEIVVVVGTTPARTPKKLRSR